MRFRTCTPRQHGCAGSQNGHSVPPPPACLRSQLRCHRRASPVLALPARVLLLGRLPAPVLARAPQRVPRQRLCQCHRGHRATLCGLDAPAWQAGRAQGEVLHAGALTCTLQHASSAHQPHHAARAVQDEEVDRLERASRAVCALPSRAEVLDSMYGRADPRPARERRPRASSPLDPRLSTRPVDARCGTLCVPRSAKLQPRGAGRHGGRAAQRRR